MDKKSLLEYLKRFNRACVLFLEPINNNINYSTIEFEFLKEFGQHYLSENHTVCYMSETMKECREFGSNEKLCTLSFNEMQYIGLSADYIEESICPSNILIINQIEKYPCFGKQYQLHLRERVLLTTKCFDVFDHFIKANEGFTMLIIRHRPDSEIFSLNLLG